MIELSILQAIGVIAGCFLIAMFVYAWGWVISKCLALFFHPSTFWSIIGFLLLVFQGFLFILW